MKRVLDTASAFRDASPEQRGTRRSDRRGTILIFFMVNLLLLSMTMAAMTRVVLLQRSIVEGNELQVQSEWLFQSAVTRAATQIRSDPAYTGEEWNISAEALGQPYGAVATISVEPADDQTKVRRVAITVVYPPDDALRAMVSRTVSVSL